MTVWCVGLYVSVWGVHVHACVWIPGVDVSCPLEFWDKVSPWTWGLLIQLAWLSSKHQASFPCLSRARMIAVCLHLSLCQSGGLNSGSHICMVLTELTPQALKTWIFKHRSISPWGSLRGSWTLATAQQELQSSAWLHVKTSESLPILRLRQNGCWGVVKNSGSPYLTSVIHSCSFCSLCSQLWIASPYTCE